MRIAALIRTNYKIDLEQWRGLLLRLREHVEDVPLPALWGKVLIVHDTAHFQIMNDPPKVPFSGALLIAFDPHLEELSAIFDQNQQTPQLSLPLVSIHR